MGEFRIGRTRASHSYPDANRPSPPPPQFASNFAIGPGLVAQDITTGGTLVLWDGINVGPSPSTDVQFTPKTTGDIIISSVLCLKNSSPNPQFVLVQVLLDGSVELPLLEAVTVPAGPSGFTAIPVLTELVAAQPIGVTKHIEIRLTSAENGVLTLAPGSSSLSVQEVPLATG